MSTRVELDWNVETSRVLGPRQRERIKTKLGRRIDSSGVLRVGSQKHRSQLRNRTEVRSRLAQLVADALAVEKSRVKTKPTRAANQRRLQEKRRRSQIKRARRVTTEPGVVRTRRRLGHECPHRAEARRLDRGEPGS